MKINSLEDWNYKQIKMVDFVDLTLWFRRKKHVLYMYCYLLHRSRYVTLSVKESIWPRFSNISQQIPFSRKLMKRCIRKLGKQIIFLSENSKYLCPINIRGHKFSSVDEVKLTVSRIYTFVDNGHISNIWYQLYTSMNIGCRETARQQNPLKMVFSEYCWDYIISDCDKENPKNYKIQKIKKKNFIIRIF